MVLAACSPGDPSADGYLEPATVSTTIPDEEITLTLSYVSDPAMLTLIDSFEAKHPNITIEHTQTALAEYTDTITATMTNDSAPDIVQFFPGVMRTLVPSGLIFDLQPYATAYDWGENFPPSSLGAFTLNQSGKRLNSGQLYALPAAQSVTGVFYNKKLLQQAGATAPPKTLKQFSQAMSKVQQAGMQPLSVGGLGGGSVQLWNALASATSDTGELNDWVFGMPESTIRTDGPRHAAQRVVDWADAEYLSPKVTSVTDEDARSTFTSGHSAFLLANSRHVAQLSESMGKNVGFLLLPPAGSGAAAVAPTTAAAYAVSSHTDHPDAAAAFLNFLTSSEAAQIQADEGLLPINTQADVSHEGVAADVAGEYHEALDGAGVTASSAYATPSMRGVLRASMQELMSGTLNVDNFLETVQTEWKNYQEGPGARAAQAPAGGVGPPLVPDNGGPAEKV